MFVMMSRDGNLESEEFKQAVENGGFSKLKAPVKILLCGGGYLSESATSLPAVCLLSVAFFSFSMKSQQNKNQKSNLQFVL